MITTTFWQVYRNVTRQPIIFNRVETCRDFKGERSKNQLIPDANELMNKEFSKLRY